MNLDSTVLCKCQYTYYTVFDKTLTIIDIDQFSWKTELNCFASAIDKGDFLLKHLHHPNGFYFD